MSLVIDASVAIAWRLRDHDGTPYADAVMDRISSEIIIVPGLFWYEVRNVLVVTERRKSIGAGAADRHLERLRALELVADNDQDDRRTVALARRHGLSGYDAAYLETAMRRAAKLATLDRKLAAAAAAEGVSLGDDRSR